jgi:hypothetical protein
LPTIDEPPAPAGGGQSQSGLGVAWRVIFFLIIVPSALMVALKWLLDL